MAGARKIDAVVTMGTAECVAEIALMHASLRAFHPDVPVILGTTSALMDALRDGQGDVAAARTVATAQDCVGDALSYLRAALAAEEVDGRCVLLPCLDQYGAINRRTMERAPGVWFPTRHADFMMEKASLLDFALQRGFKAPLFVDCDITMLAPLPDVPEDAVVGLSPHKIRKADARLFGEYNGGWVFAADPAVVFEWRRATHESRYFDQASLEDVAASFGQRVHEFPTGVNFGYWRMFQADEPATAVVGRFGTCADRGVITLDGAPLQSVHTHFFMPSGSRVVPVFNRLVASWADEARIHLRYPGWQAASAMLRGWRRRARAV